MLDLHVLADATICAVPLAGANAGLGLENMRHVISIHDVVSDTMHQFAPTYHNYVLYSNGGSKEAPKTVGSSYLAPDLVLVVSCIQAEQDMPDVSRVARLNLVCGVSGESKDVCGGGPRDGKQRRGGKEFEEGHHGCQPAGQHGAGSPQRRCPRPSHFRHGAHALIKQYNTSGPWNPDDPKICSMQSGQ